MSQPRSPLPPAAAGARPKVEISGTLTRAEVAEVTRLTQAATRADGVSPLSEHVSLHLRYGGEGPDRNILLVLPDREHRRLVVGYAHLDPTDEVAGSAAELVVHPEFRRHGFGRMLVEAAAAETPDGRLRLWAHGDHPGARRLATGMGFRVVRRLEQYRRSLAKPLPELRLPEGVRLRAFRPGQDEEAWLTLNARAFAGHPEQGGWTRRDLQAREREHWFDPEGFLVAEQDPQGPGAEGAERPRMIAFHWTKVHGGDPDPAPRHERHEPHDGQPHGHDPIGEVYVVGVDPAEQGRGLGRAMTIAGLRWLQQRGLSQAMLYVEADNEPALAVYRSLGFTHWDTDVMFYRSPAEPAPAAQG